MQEFHNREMTNGACMQVWPGAVHFPDFINPEGQAWWLDHVRDFYANIPFDGLWVDMNEASNFCTGHVCELPPDGILDFVDPSALLSPSHTMYMTWISLVYCTVFPGENALEGTV